MYLSVDSAGFTGSRITGFTLLSDINRVNRNPAKTIIRANSIKAMILNFIFLPH